MSDVPPEIKPEDAPPVTEPPPPVAPPTDAQPLSDAPPGAQATEPSALTQPPDQQPKAPEAKGAGEAPITLLPPPEETPKRKTIEPKKQQGTIFDQQPGPVGKPPADNTAKVLAGTLQTFFAQEEKTGEATVQKALRRPKKVFDNSYRLQANNPYHRDRVQKVLDSTLEEMMDGVKYSSDTANDIAIKIAEKLRSRILSLRFDRYKIIVMANVGPLNRQGLHIGYRCLWDPERDSHNYGSFKNPHAFCSAVVYGVYFE